MHPTMQQARYAVIPAFPGTFQMKRWPLQVSPFTATPQSAVGANFD
jgi:hypothetical protein